MKTFISELEQHKAMMKRRIDCRHVAGELVAVSSSGCRKKILNAVGAARLKGMVVIGITGYGAIYDSIGAGDRRPKIGALGDVGTVAEEAY
ncbi:hypothetical protein V3O24_01455 [Methylobacter sp. Wu8]|uniref:hypothetical protein n=1 Tax=Methylobacter sp. Wu8 TaxID=3118457 RepID=UPI002F342B16